MNLENKINIELYVPTSSFTLLDTNAELGDLSSVVVPASIALERNSSYWTTKDVTVVPDFSISTTSMSDLRDVPIEFTCAGRSTILWMQYNGTNSTWSVVTPSGEVEIENRIIERNKIRQKGGVGYLADLSYVLFGIAYRELGQNFQWKSYEKAIKSALGDHELQYNKTLTNNLYV